MSTPTEKQIWRSHLTAAADVAEHYRTRRGYSQARLYGGLGLPPSEHQEDDCSAYTAKSFKLANNHSRLKVPDPLGENFNRSGNTDTAYHYLKDIGGKKIVVTNAVIFFPGDVAIFDNPHTGRPTDHMMFCSHKGNRSYSRWSSHGHESTVFDRDAPEQVSLFYASRMLTLKAVFRPHALL
jgi:hypothetical protein